MLTRFATGISACGRASCSRTLTTTAAAAAPPRRAIPKPQAAVSDPASFLSSISRPRRDLASNSSLTSAIGEQWSNIFTIRSNQLKAAGITTKDRRFFLWAREKFRQGANPDVFVIDAKPKKKVRGWGARVQTSERIRVRGVRRPGEK
ncbi:mitochondrial 37S ribosomal protein mS41 [Mycosarcoma maydis]|uniref:Small ribosomal subunit protein mS41 n=1 Tax=Mycosarcoma maydis TaxID=5270 RepID=A0A0D1E9D5_MYCMD|nr:uncharacterized protein UMAG_10617 [Ustilago maydis 521]KIS70995.1 hypothetical protein UMAG_10617 [Ustilago maydis 521]|eukprot:XP_011387351.1 hypothetical protein UMAG_10617 [Ustilago maydis 521]